MRSTVFSPKGGFALPEGSRPEARHLVSGSTQGEDGEAGLLIAYSGCVVDYRGEARTHFIAVHDAHTGELLGPAEHAGGGRMHLEPGDECAHGPPPRRSTHEHLKHAQPSVPRQA